MQIIVKRVVSETAERIESLVDEPNAPRLSAIRCCSSKMELFAGKSLVTFLF